MTWRVLDLFSGLGGFALGLERAGFETVAFCEIDPFCRKVLAKHWPDVPIFEDVRDLDATRLGRIDVVCGGFPCQDISAQGAKWADGRAGIDGARSGLWFEMLRLIREIRPQIAIVENVADLLDNGLGRILGGLAESGYDAQWDSIPASYLGAPHRRERVWIVAHDPGQREQGVAEITLSRQPAFSWVENERGFASFPDRSDLYESQLCRSRYGISQRLDALGNAVVPQIPELIGRAIMAAETMEAEDG